MKEHKVILATRNMGKVQEFTTLLKPFSLSVVCLTDYPDLPEVEETGTTFEENALLKAVAISKASGLVAIADDSGLEVDALNKAPGVYSARYSATPDVPATDEKNIQKLLSVLENTPEDKRTARFRCCMAVATPKGLTMTTNGTWEGRILNEKKGQNGFGYDPVFFDASLGLSSAEMSPEQKNSRSHRGQATQKLLEKWETFWQQWEQLSE